MNLQNIKTGYAQFSMWGLPILIMLLAITLFTCHTEREDRRGLSARLNASASRTKQLENRNGALVAQNNQLLTGDKRALKELTDSVFALRERQAGLIASVSTYSRIVQTGSYTGIKTVYDTIQGETVYLPQPADPDLIRVPRGFKYEDSTIALAGTVKKNSVDIDSLEIPNTLHLRTVEEKTGFLRLGRTTQVQAFNSNPAFKNTEIVSVSVKKKPTFYHRVIKPVIFAAAAGYVGYKVGKL